MNVFKLNGKTYHHPLYTRAMEIDRYILVSNAPYSMKDAEIEKIALAGTEIDSKFEGHLNYDSASGKWYDNKGEVDIDVVMGETMLPDFDFKTFSDFDDFEEECK